MNRTCQEPCRQDRRVVLLSDLPERHCKLQLLCGRNAALGHGHTKLSRHPHSLESLRVLLLSVVVAAKLEYSSRLDELGVHGLPNVQRKPAHTNERIHSFVHPARCCSPRVATTTPTWAERRCPASPLRKYALQSLATWPAPYTALLS